MTTYIRGVDDEHLELSQPARLFRVGTANAADAGLDMWANFGPAVQVKHVTLFVDQIGEIVNRIMADQVVVVCKDAEVGVIEAVMRQVGLGERIRGFITEVDLIVWYAISMSPKYGVTLGRTLIDEVARQFELEFPGSNSDALDSFFLERGYNSTMLTTIWTP